MRFIANDKSAIIIFMVLLLAFKALDINVWRYDRLRTHHSKNFIQNNYVGVGEWLFFTKSIREIGILLPIVNIVTFLTFAGYGVLFLMLSQHMDIKLPMAVCSIVFAASCVVTTLAVIHNYSALGINVKGNSASYGERVITALAFSAIMCFLAFMKARGVLF